MSAPTGERTGLGRMRAAGFFPLALVAVSLLALAVLPVTQSRHINGIEEEIVGTLEPARSLSHELTLLKARQMAQFQGWLLSGDPGFADTYRRLLADERVVFDDLQATVEQADLEIRGELANLHAASQEWEMAHEGEAGPLASEDGRRAYIDLLPAEQERYGRVLGASRALEAAVADHIAQARVRMEAARRRQTAMSLVLAVLALGATLAVGVVGRRLGDAVSEAEERRADALRARRLREAVLEASADGVVGLDLGGVCTSLNRTGSELLGMPEHDAQGRTVHELLHGKAPSEHAHEPGVCPLLRAMEAGEDRDEPDDVVWRRDGSSFPARWHLRPMVDGREIRGGVLTLSDMTDVRAAREALERAVKARDEMMAVVSHDLRNPLGTVSAAADLLVDLPLSPEQRAEQIAIIRRGAARMSRLIEDLLDVARIESGALPVDLAPLRVDSLVEDAVSLFAHQAREKGVVLETSVSGGPPPIQADRARLEQVLSNLLGNAVKFTPEGGRVTVEVSTPGDGIRISVVDTGPGIDADSLGHLFERFWQVDPGRRDGTGLGLTIVKGIVDAHGGRVRVDSEPGEGSAFHVDLPVTGGASSGGEPA